ncbi:hypothetical protein [[Muricauda] lutisoli]|uniref:Uncharacterized protein n=1 Tax=[Muricauda] lutisoli TaxID=2816035 RepID=A0ABS3EUX0_9FLAO|nr:hypothetical protein [[Muricauda] lutisoli]MBO0329741.1 hypothetical protein [[Muricauda] lutisoli]
MIRKLFGPSKLQEEFQKSISLQLRLIISSIDEMEISIKQSQIKKKNSLTKIIFNFETNIFLIQGDQFEEVFNDTRFQIVRIDNLPDVTEIYLSEIDSSDIIVIKCIVYRNYILFQGALENWHFKISSSVQISH